MMKMKFIGQIGQKAMPKDLKPNPIGQCNGMIYIYISNKAINKTKHSLCQQNADLFAPEQKKKGANKNESTYTFAANFDIQPQIASTHPLMPHQQIFEGNICGFETKIVLNSQGIMIFLWSATRKKCFQSKILYEYSGKSKQIQDIFTNLDQFYVYITQFSEDRERINISQSGRIQVIYHLNKSKNKQPPIVYIDTEVLLVGHQIRAEKKLHSDIGDIKQQNLRLQNKINNLSKLNQQNRKDLDQLKRMLEKDETRYNDASSSDEEDAGKENEQKKKKKKKYSVISGGRSGVKELNTTIKQLATQLNAFKGQIHKVPKKAGVAAVRENSYIDPLDQNAIFGNKMIITVDENNKYLHMQYKIEGNLITKIRKYGRYQLLSKEVIPAKGKHYFVMFIQHISFKIFSLGIVSQRRRNYQNSHLSPDLISYFAKTGAIWEDGDCRVGGPVIPNGVEMRMVVDMDNFTLAWFMDKREIASTVIRSHLRKQRLVAYLEFNYEGDRVYWNERE